VFLLVVVEAPEPRLLLFCKLGSNYNILGFNLHVFSIKTSHFRDSDFRFGFLGSINPWIQNFIPLALQINEISIFFVHILAIPESLYCKK